MLTAIRTHTKSLVVKILAGLLVVSFAVWGIEDMFTLATSSASPIFEVGSLEGDEDVADAQYRSSNAESVGAAWICCGLMAAMIAIFTPLALPSFLFVVQPFRQAATPSGRPTSHPAE